jgi:hypothetical protein
VDTAVTNVEIQKDVAMMQSMKRLAMPPRRVDMVQRVTLPINEGAELMINFVLSF